MKRKIMIATCPVCGNVLFRGEFSDVEIRCSKCKENLIVELTGDYVSVSRCDYAGTYTAELCTTYNTS